MVKNLGKTVVFFGFCVFARCSLLSSLYLAPAACAGHALGRVENDEKRWENCCIFLILRFCPCLPISSLYLAPPASPGRALRVENG